MTSPGSTSRSSSTPRRPRSGSRWNGRCIPPSASRASTATPSGPRAASDESDPAALFEQVYVDPGPLRGNVRAALRRAPQVGLADLVGRSPLTHGVAELVAYLSLRDDAFTIVYDDTSSEQVSWTGLDGKRRTASLPRVTFTRSVAESTS